MTRPLVDVFETKTFMRELREGGQGTVVRYGEDHANDRNLSGVARRAALLGLGTLHWMRVEGQRFLAPVFVRNARLFCERSWHRASLPGSVRAKLEREEAERADRADKVAALTRDGLEQREIADRLGVSKSTVKEDAARRRQVAS